MSETNGQDVGEMLRTLLGSGSPVNGTLEAEHRANIAESRLDPRTHALVRIAALATLGALPISYAWQVQMAEECGVTADEMLGVLVALKPTIGTARVLNAAANLAPSLGLEEAPQEVQFAQ